MKTRWRVAFLIVACYAGAVMAQLQPPAPAPPKPAQENQHKATPNESKTESEQQPPAPESSGVGEGLRPLAATHPKETGNNRSSEPPRDWWAIVASALNLFFTGCLVFLMRRQWLAMEKQAAYMSDALGATRDAADAAAASAAAAKAGAEATKESNAIANRSLELGRRAWIVILGAPRFEHGSGWVFDSVDVENISDMPAIIRGFDTGLVEGDPKSLSLKEEGRSVPSDVVIRGCRINLEFPPIPPPSVEDPAAPWSVIQASPVFCIVAYTDCFEKEWTTTVCWNMSPYDDWERYYYRLK